MTWHRRDVLKLTGGALAGGVLARAGRAAEPAPAPAKPAGFVMGHPLVAPVGMEVLAAGGNAVDAAIATALAAGVVALPACGIGGFGGHMVIARARDRKVTAIDFNTAAPAAARADMFPVDDKGMVKDELNERGWLAVGVPGTLAGLQLAAERYGTRPFASLVQPAIRLARDGFALREPMVKAIRTERAHLLQDPASAKLLLKDGEPPEVGSTFRNPDLAAMLETLAEAGSVEPFYRGSIARRIAAAFQKNGGLVTEKDLADFRARELPPLELTWRGYRIVTAPLTAGGATVLEALAILRAAGWEATEAGSPRDLHLRLEALRVAWDDRLRLLGDPEQVKVPLDRLLSETYAKERAAQVEKAVREGSRVPTTATGGSSGGTVHLSAADGEGSAVALTLTHGSLFGARVTVEGLGLILGHGMSRFDPLPGHPNAPAPGKRPLSNMCPTVVLRNDKPVLALGGVGFRRIPNAVFEVLARCVGRDASLEDAVAAPRVGVEAGTEVSLEVATPDANTALVKRLGYSVETAPIAFVNAVGIDLATGAWRGASR